MHFTAFTHLRPRSANAKLALIALLASALPVTGDDEFGANKASWCSAWNPAPALHRPGCEPDLDFS